MSNIEDTLETAEEVIIEDTPETAEEVITEEPKPERVFRFLDPLACNPLRAVSPEGIQGSILQHQDGQDWNRELLQSLMDKTVLEDENGEPCYAITIPLEVVDLPEEQTGVMVDVNLQASRQGWFWMLDPSLPHMAREDGAQAAYQTLAELAQAVHVLSLAGQCALKTWDGHQMFFNLDYSNTGLVLDGVDLVAHSDWTEDVDPVRYANHALAAVLLYALTGAWPDRDDIPVEISCAADRLSFTDETTEPTGSPDSVVYWEALPEQLRAAFLKANTSPLVGEVSASEWRTLLESAVPQTVKCPCCGHMHSEGAIRCPYCRRETNLKDLWVRFLVENKPAQRVFALSFGRGIVFTGKQIDAALTGSPLLRLVYNAKQNALGLRNLGPTAWLLNTAAGVKTIASGSVAAIAEGDLIVLDQAGTVCLKFEKYEVPFDPLSCGGDTYE